MGHNNQSRNLRLILKDGTQEDECPACWVLFMDRHAKKTGKRLVVSDKIAKFAEQIN